MSTLMFIAPLAVVLLIAAPLVGIAQGKVTGRSAIKNRFALHFGAFALACIAAVALPASGVAFADEAAAAVSEDPKAFGKAIIFVVLGEGIAIYGLLISILIINKL